MWTRSYSYLGGVAKFFRIVLDSESLTASYVTNFNLITHHGWSLTEIENLIPWERQIYIALLEAYIKEKNENNK